jgi:lipopolysaccharide export system ATP-binding protein
MHLNIQSIGKCFKKRWVVKNVSMMLYPGEIVGLLGANGAGKTTAFKMVAGLISPSCGDVYLYEKSLNKLELWQRINLGIGYLPQDSTLFRSLSTLENLILAIEGSGNGEDIKQRCIQMLLRFGLEHVQHIPAGMLSGGERRRLELARALILSPKFLLLDEPFAGVDPIHVEELSAFIRTLAQEGMGIFITDHNVRDTLSICQRIYILHEGSIVTTGSPQEVIENPIAQKAYLGTAFKL